jgi:hypothetical protein
MIKTVRALTMLFVAFAVSGCGTGMADPGAKSASYQTLIKADEAFEAKGFAEALPFYDQAITAGVVHPDVLADAYIKRAICKLETGDLDGAAEDLSQAERGGAVGEDYQKAQKILREKRSGS